MDVELRAFPSRDDDFIAYAQAEWAALPEARTPEAFQHALRTRYPAAIVRVQEELARHGDQPEVWYVFRTAAIGTPAIDDEADAGGPGRHRRTARVPRREGNPDRYSPS